MSKLFILIFFCLCKETFETSKSREFVPKLYLHSDQLGKFHTNVKYRFEDEKNESVSFEKDNGPEETEDLQGNLQNILKDINLKDLDEEQREIALTAMAKGYLIGKESNADISYGKLFVYYILNAFIVMCMAIVVRYFIEKQLERSFMKDSKFAPEKDVHVKFQDVKGCDEAKNELQDIVGFLKNPKKFNNLGGKLPKGVLLCGPPGTGKTLLAKAVAGEAKVPFFYKSGSEFQGMFVGSGAKRVRLLFEAARKNAPCVIFIDEIDSLGGKRTDSGRYPYANQAINQLLTAMDGFSSNEEIVVLGATNRRNDLDKALLRPGRFDSQITVGVPDLKGRKELLELYIGKTKHSESIDVDVLSKMTSGFTGADVQQLVNTAAIRAAVLEKSAIDHFDFEYAFDKQTIGLDLQSRIRSLEDRTLTAYHESGHTLVSVFTKYADPVQKVTIVAKGQTGGHARFLPINQSSNQTRAQLMAYIDVALGGRAAEELVFGKDLITVGASNDLEKATEIAGTMMKSCGMSDKVGLRTYKPEDFANGNIGENKKAQIDDEINTTLNDAYKRALKILRNRRKELDMLAKALLEHETLDSVKIKSIVFSQQKENVSDR